ncbi:methylated-DNA--[protein]-cysteine S-methyltransferase [Jeotgalibaca sp. A127]|uniref:methylated-DNA--[protein]-cysteine S-methyltransferase n=1 Tax=Jeotgalibaca sp. A127 TaxID=3457324 RepID=UPI003FD21097
MNHILIKSPIGLYVISASEKGITRLDRLAADEPIPKTKETPLLLEAKKQLEEYFNGVRKDFDLPLDTKGTPFQEAVWQALRTIPYGKTASYKDIAVAIGNPKAVRAVGGANNRNPISIITPCHRVIGITGKLVGYGGGMDAKEYLLRMELENS